jgi:hypothetical protein
MFDPLYPLMLKAGRLEAEGPVCESIMPYVLWRRAILSI